MNNCPNCYYPITEFDNVCPSCKYDLKEINKREKKDSKWSEYNSRPSLIVEDIAKPAKQKVSHKEDIKIFKNFSDSNYDLLTVKKKSNPYYKTFFGLQDKNDNIILDVIYDAICPLEGNNQRRFKLKGKTGIMNSEFDIIFQSDYLWITSADKNGFRRFVDKKENMGILSPDFQVVAHFKNCKWIYSLEDKNRRVIFSKSKPFGSELLKYMAGSFFYVSTLGITGMVANYKESTEFLKKHRESKTNNYDEAEEIFYNSWDILEKYEGEDSIIIETINSFIPSDKYPAFGLIDNKNNFLIEPKYHFISPLLEDKTRNCLYKKKFYVFDEEKRSIQEKN